MARDPNLHARRKNMVLSFYKKLDSVYEHGVKKHTTIWCIHETAEKFFLAPKTVEGYVYGG
ncbi:hypothetical protein [Christiangramia lutea]|nr:hypothetical protein [Christiangramia lutea]